MSVITVHHLEHSRSQRVLWLLEELGTPYEIRPYKRHPKTSLAPPELRQVHPLGKSPVIVDGDVTMAETGAIVEYLLERYGQGRLVPPAGTAEKRRWTYWMHFAEGSAMPPLVMKLVFLRVRSAPMPFFARPIARGIADKVVGGFVQPSIDRHNAFIESELAASPWFAGTEFSAADVMMSFPVEAAAVRGGLDERYPNTLAWLKRIQARPAYARALERGGPYQLLG
jgi:glutathione S-transferase